MRFLVAGFFLLQICRATWAQEPQAPADSARADTVPVDSVRMYGHHGPLMFAMAAWVVGAAVAPSAFTTLAAPDTTPRTKLPSPTSDRVSAYLTIGASWIEEQLGAYSASVEVLENGWYADLRVETYQLPRHFQYQSISGGYLIRRKRVVAGGVTVGYRRAARDRTQRGVTLGFPLIVDGTDGTMRLESTYVFSPSGVNWNYRLLAELVIGDGPLSAGFSAEAKSLPLQRGSKVFTGAISLLLGVHL